MAQTESAGTTGISSSQQPSLPSSSPQTSSFTMETHDTSQTVATQGKQATIHDFLSLCGMGASSTSSTSMPNLAGSQQSSTTQDFLQPLQKTLIPSGSGNSNVLPNGFAYSVSKSYTGNNEPGAGQQSCYTFGNGSFELRENFQTKYRSANISFGPKGHVAHVLPLNNKHWQQQSGVEVSEGNKRLSRVPSEEDDDEDDESFDHTYGPKKDGRYPKGENTQQMEGRNQDNKATTPRSKHSATEQRRRSKINDRFQMLRQLLPNADQKRDKASFLLEVIEYIQMLHEKVKKYEGSEFRGQHLERTKVLSWDRTSGQQDVTFSSTQDIKEVPDSNGYVRSRLSPLRVMSEDGMTTPELVCTMVQPSAMQAVSNYDSKPQISKPIPLSFSQGTTSAMVENIQATNSMYQSMSPEGQTVFGQLLRPEEQTTMKTRALHVNKAETVLPHMQQSRNMLVPQDAHQVAEQKFLSSRSIDQNRANLNYRRSEEEAEGSVRLSQVVDISSSGKDVIRSPFGFDGRGVHGAPDGCRVEQSSEVFSANEQEVFSANEQEPPAVLGGVINISSVYSQGLLDTLTRALQSSGVDLAQATISVQIDLGKPEASSSKQMMPLTTGVLPPQNKKTLSSHESEPSKKKLKVEAV